MYHIPVSAHPTMDEKHVKELRKLIEGRETKKAHRHLRLVSGLGRFRILTLLKAHGEPLNVTTIAAVLRSSTSAVSHELRVLRRNGMVLASVRGREVHYRTNGALEKLWPGRHR